MNFDKLESYINNGEYDQKIEKKLKYIFLYKYLIYAIFILVLFIFSVIFSKRVILFSSMFKMKLLFMIIYYFVYVIAFIILSYIVYKVYMYIKYDDSWKNKALKIYKKTDLISFIFSAISILMFIVTFIVTPCRVSGDSMNDSYKDGERILSSSIYFELENNDVIIFNAKNYNYSNTMELYIKRVVATEGDILSFKENTLYVNSEVACTSLSEDRYLNIINSIGISDTDIEVIIPEKKLLVLGDNRAVSYDSRSFGMIDERDIFGKLIFPKREMK